MSDASNTNLANEPNFSSSNLNRNSVQFKVKFPDSTTLIRPDTITKRNCSLLLTKKFNKDKKPRLNFMGCFLEEKKVKGTELKEYSRKFKENSLIENDEISSWILDLFGRRFSEIDRCSPSLLTNKLKSILIEESFIHRLKESQINRLSDSFSFNQSQRKLNIKLRLEKIVNDFATLIINICIKLSLYTKKKIDEFKKFKMGLYSETEKRFYMLLEEEMAIKLDERNEIITSFLNSNNYSNFLSDSSLTFDDLNNSKNYNLNQIVQIMRAQLETIATEEDEKNWNDYYLSAKIFFEYFVSQYESEEDNLLSFSIELQLFVTDLFQTLRIDSLMELNKFLKVVLQPLSCVICNDWQNTQTDPRLSKINKSIIPDLETLDYDYEMITKKNCKIVELEINKKFKYKKISDEIQDKLETQKIFDQLYRSETDNGLSGSDQNYDFLTPFSSFSSSMPSINNIFEQQALKELDLTFFNSPLSQNMIRELDQQLDNQINQASNLQNEPFEYFDFDFDFNLADQFQFTDKSIENINKEINQSNENQIITEFQNVTNIESNNSTCISSCQEINENDEEMKLTDIKSPVIDLIPINQKLFEDAFNNIKQTSTVPLTDNQMITEFQNVTNIETNNSTCISSCQEINENDEEMKLTDIKSPVIDLIPINQKLFEDAFNNIKQTSTVSPSRNILKSILTMEPNNPSIDKPGYFK